ncbi:hypothetical protein Tco_1504362 [Tanacetum coccineum]
MRRLEATGTYTDDEINRLARRGKQRGHFPGVSRVLPARATAGPSMPASESMLNSLHKKVDFIMSLFKSDSKYSDMFSQFESGGASGSGECGDDEETVDAQEDEDEDGDGDRNMCHGGTNYLTEKYVGPTLSLGNVSLASVPQRSFPSDKSPGKCGGSRLFRFKRAVVMKVKTVETVGAGDWWCGGYSWSGAVVTGGAVVARWWRRVLAIDCLYLTGKQANNSTIKEDYFVNGGCNEAHVANFYNLDKSEGVDFRRWQKKIHFLLSTMSVVYVLTTPMPEDKENETVEQIMKMSKWENDDYVSRGIILNGMFDSLFDLYQYVEFGKELCDSLEAK